MSSSWQWVRFQEFAEGRRDSAAECDMRNAVSRSYYFAHHNAKEYAARSRRETPPRYSAHQWTIDTLDQGNADEVGVAKILIRLRRQREQADYEAASRLNNKAVALALAEARQLEKIISRLTSRLQP